MKKWIKYVALVSALVFLLSSAAVSAMAESTDDIVNVLVVVAEGTGSNYFPAVPLVISMNLTAKTVKVIYVYFDAQITAVAKGGETVTIPISLIPNCEPAEIANGFASTFGIPIDRYLIYQYQYGSYQPVLSAFDMLFPISIEIPEEILGTAQHSTINGNMKAIASANGREYTPIDEAGVAQLDAVGFIAYHTAIPDSVWSSGDRYTMAMADYAYSDIKHEAATKALRAVIGMLSPDTIAAVLQMFVNGQTTNITADDIALWAESGMNIDENTPYMSVPGYEGVELVDGQAGSISVSAYQNKMLSYDTEAFRRQIQTFLYGE